MIHLLLSPKALPTAMILLSLGAAISYGIRGDWHHMIYWLAAAVLTATVTY